MSEIHEYVGIAKALAAKNGYELDTNQELSQQLITHHLPSSTVKLLREGWVQEDVEINNLIALKGFKDASDGSKNLDRIIQKNGDKNFRLVPGLALKLSPKQKVEILGHGSIGGFLMHCAWNSISERVVRMDENGVVGRDEFGKCVGSLITGKDGLKMNLKVNHLKEVAATAMSQDGSSTVTVRCGSKVAPVVNVFQ
uniref:Hydroquinone glucosyltransferase-like n=1 Tax=Tanacetum cinerariifolium TaxID=118510 RepID=A0A699HVG1_TANCI|nr:hydroquinone glucosyltransferase-like [Tanacetum cinerariifolium]